MCIYKRFPTIFALQKMCPRPSRPHHGLTSCIIFQASSGQIQNWTGKHQILRSGAFFCTAVTAAQRFWAGGGRKQWWLVGLLRVAGWLAACPFFQHSAINRHAVSFAIFQPVFLAQKKNTSFENPRPIDLRGPPSNFTCFRLGSSWNPKDLHRLWQAPAALLGDMFL